MKDASAGNFEVSIGDPYPCWVTIAYQRPKDDWTEIRIQHKELSDLSYVIHQAMKICKIKLGDEDEREV